MDLPYVGQKMRQGGIEEERRKVEVERFVEAKRQTDWALIAADQEDTRRAWEDLRKKEGEEKVKVKSSASMQNPPPYM